MATTDSESRKCQETPQGVWATEFDVHHGRTEGLDELVELAHAAVFAGMKAVVACGKT
jgi:hypothetical protein